jgi:galactosamine-6-phosphate isomerase
MNLVVADTYEDLSMKAADRLLELAGEMKEPLISPASGDSPAGLYRHLVQRANRKDLNIVGWNFVGLDEWTGMNGQDEGSCRYHLNHQLFGPLEVAEENICFFDGRCEDLHAECRRTDLFILDHGGIDVAIVGLGMNGHIGMNEPGTDPSLHSHIAEIDPITQQVGQKYFTSETKLSSGITLGIATLMEAKHILLIVSGDHKARIVQQLIHAEPTPQLPASLLRNHPGLTIFLDKAAAQLIHPHD